MGGTTKVAIGITHYKAAITVGEVPGQSVVS